ncbi:MAG: hypothetical protein Unbinned4497contig1000_45 [Prokaryotic dsDNA virus sp.]|nr:MAG: hypothetical protein Unbinned4497contig1000_45 [Prokaryotic dsDNA virus sp.]|tara:strand:+ start:7622 stop:9298 length:1677 start_codon:yes stop_codon:yes gene_type:complete
MLGFVALAKITLADDAAEQNYVFEAGTGTFTLTGQTVNLNNQPIITAETGSFALTGQDNQFLLNNVNGFGSYALTGQDAQFKFSMVAERGIFALSGFPHVKNITMDGRHVVHSFTGQDSVFSINYPVDNGSFALSVFDAELLRSVLAETGTFTLTGQDAILQGVLSFVADAGTFTATGQDASFTVTRKADAGSFAATEQDASFAINFPVDVTSNPSGATSVQYDVSVASGTNEYGSGNKYYIDGLVGASPTLQLMAGVTYRFSQADGSNGGHPLRFSTTPNGTHGGGTEYTTGVTVNGVAGSSGSYTEITPTATTPRLFYYCTVHSGMGGQASANGGVHALTGQDATLIKDLKLAADKADFVLTGQTSVFNVKISAAHGSFILTGQDIALNKAVNINAEVGNFVLTGQDALKGISEIAAAASYALTGQDVSFNVTLNAETGSFILTGQDALKDIIEIIPSASFVLTGQDVTFRVNISLIAEHAIFTLTGQDAEPKFVLIRTEFDGYEQQSEFIKASTVELTTGKPNIVEIEAVDENDLQLFEQTQNSVTIEPTFNRAA